MWTSSTAVAARIAPSPAPGPAQSRTSIGRSRLPPAASVAPASAAELAAVASDQRGEALLDRGHPPRQPGLGRVEDRGHRGRDAERFTIGPLAQAGRAPEWIAMIPPASTV